MLDIFLKCQKLPREMSINVWLLSIFHSTLFFCNFFFFFRYLFFQRAENCMVKWYSCSDVVSWLGGPAILEKSEIHLKNLLSPTPSQHNKHAAVSKKERCDNAFPWWLRITEDIVTVKKQAAVKTASAPTPLRGLDFTTLKTIQLMPRCGTDSFFQAWQLTCSHTSQMGLMLFLITDIHIIEWAELIRICAYFSCGLSWEAVI